MRPRKFILFFCMLIFFCNATYGSTIEESQRRTSRQSRNSNTPNSVVQSALTPQSGVSASEDKHLEDWHRYQRALSLFDLENEHANALRQRTTRRSSSVQEYLAEPAELNGVENVRFYAVGQILKQGRSLWIATVSVEHQQTPDGISPLSPAQNVIYERIRHRKPTHPGDYRIPPVSFATKDFIVVPQENAQEGVKKIAKLRGSRGMVSVLAGNDDQVIEFRSGYILMRRNRRYPLAGGKKNTAHAVYWAHMWIVRELLPTVEGFS